MTAHMIWTLTSLPSAASAALQSSISALERDIASLESKSSGLEPWLGWFTLVVAIGVALEVLVVVRDHKKEVDEWRVCELIPERTSLWKIAIEIASILLVIVGVMGEFGVGLKISSINGQLRAKGVELRNKSDQLLALVTQEAGNAADSADRAENSAKVAKEQAGQAKDDAGLAKKNVKIVGQQVEALGPRTLSAEQQRDIAKALSNARGTRFHPTTIGSYSLDGEGTALAGQLIQVFLDARIGPLSGERAGRIETGGFEWGVSIRGPMYEMQFMTAIRDALTNIGKLKEVSINGAQSPRGVVMGGRGGIGGKAAIGGGGGSPVQQRPPVRGPIEVWVGIRPPIVLPQSGKPQ
jgi:hypothetical protein